MSVAASQNKEALKTAAGIGTRACHKNNEWGTDSECSKLGHASGAGYFGTNVGFHCQQNCKVVEKVDQTFSCEPGFSGVAGNLLKSD